MKLKHHFPVNYNYRNAVGVDCVEPFLNPPQHRHGPSKPCTIKRRKNANRVCSSESAFPAPKRDEAKASFPSMAFSIIGKYCFSCTLVDARNRHSRLTPYKYAVQLKHSLRLNLGLHQLRRCTVTKPT